MMHNIHYLLCSGGFVLLRPPGQDRGFNSMLYIQEGLFVCSLGDIHTLTRGRMRGRHRAEKCTLYIHECLSLASSESV